MIQWGHDKVAAAKAKRAWKALPPQFEQDAVRFAFELIKPHFCKVRGIKQRIRASKATTFEELEAAIAPTSPSSPPASE
jgi:hypothetical protein